MSKPSNEKKKQQLGMAVGTARNKLQKRLMFMFAQKCGMDNCFQCGEKIETLRELSIEHKVPWLNSKSPIDLFMDVTNVAFSHLSCNIKAARPRPSMPCPSITAYRNGCRCDGCKELKRTENREWSRKKRGTDPANYRTP